VVRDDSPAVAALEGGVVAIGNFDGVHRGHRTVIAAAVRRAEALGGPAVALTFEPHPRRFLRPQSPLFRLTDEAAKLRLLAASGLDGALVLTFDRALASLSAEDFITRILVGRLAVKGVAIGFDFHYGKDRRGRGLGFPTANLRLDADCGLKHGIYAVRARVRGEVRDGVASFGRRPTFDDGPPLLEVHLFDFSRELYGAAIDVAFLGWIRAEAKFAKIEDLIARMDEDARLAREALARTNAAFPALGMFVEG
jgi:FAD synthase